jgi:hypothetical protein
MLRPETISLTTTMDLPRQPMKALVKPRDKSVHRNELMTSHIRPGEWVVLERKYWFQTNKARLQ